MKSRVKLLGLLTLLPLASLSLALADSKQADGGDDSATIEAAGEDASPSAEARETSAMMGDLIFDHEEHAEEMDLECTDCHHETNAAPLEFPHEEFFHDFWIDCGTCHHEAGSPELEPQSCYDCHDTKMKGIADERLSIKVILHKNCWTCHEVETGVTASESCEICHTGMPDDV